MSGRSTVLEYLIQDVLSLVQRRGELGDVSWGVEVDYLGSREESMSVRDLGRECTSPPRPVDVRRGSYWVDEVATAVLKLSRMLLEPVLDYVHTEHRGTVVPQNIAFTYRYLMVNCLRKHKSTKRHFTCLFSRIGGRGVLAVSLLASHQGEPGSIPGWITPDFYKWELCQTMLLVDGFSRGSPVSSGLAFQLRSILTSLHSHRLSRPRC
ncbi:hypothetical protein PR048_030963 [Dryococelus australis]|uniref:Uncharacterized protein n=1 Tax=Dryococelus australis TaxID=614101 RepID=A0ABQ9GB37_9NEOP|nr:hypothetical protein PR048_030963 [Dryococelus australis]